MYIGHSALAMVATVCIARCVCNVHTALTMTAAVCISSYTTPASLHLTPRCVHNALRADEGGGGARRELHDNGVVALDRARKH